MPFRRSWRRAKAKRAWSEPAAARAHSRPPAVGPERLVAFGRALRDAGSLVPPGAVEDFCRAIALLEPGELYWAGRATLVSSRDEIAVYDRVFRAFFGGGRAAVRPPSPPPARDAFGDDADRRGGREPERRRDARERVASAEEVLRAKSFAQISDDERAALQALIARVSLAVPTRRSRRLERARAGVPDLRATMRASMRTGGEPLARRHRRRRSQRRRLVLVLDVSGSMVPYSRALLVLAHAAMRVDRRWEAYCLSTRLTRVTGALRSRDPDAALEAVAGEVGDWDGGTKLGASLRELLAGDADMLRGAVVVVCSDGLEVGDPALLRGQMARLSRLAHRVVWLNPLAASPRYEPLARGMAAALPHVDVLLSGHNVASLDELGRRLATL